MSGPGAMASPAWRADQPHTPCSQSTIDRSIAPKEAEKKIATNDDPPVNPRDLNSEGWTRGLSLVQQWNTNRPMSSTAPASVPTMAADPHPQPLPLTSPRVRAPMPAVASDGPDGIRLFDRVARYVGQPSPTDD